MCTYWKLPRPQYRAIPLPVILARLKNEISTVDFNFYNQCYIIDKAIPLITFFLSYSYKGGGVKQVICSYPDDLG